MKKIYFNKHLDLAACNCGQIFKIALIQRLFRWISKKGKQQAKTTLPRWRDFLLVFLVHHCFILFQGIDKLRWLFMKLKRRIKID